MHNKKLNIFISILTAILFFSVAGLCGQCGLAQSTEEETTAEEAEEDKDESSSKNTEEDKNGSETTEEVSGEKKAPTIELEIYMGQVYSATDGVCFYRIEAKVTGNPKPTVEFSRDDSNHAWGDYKVQINLDDPGDTYTLEATAENSEGSDFDSLELTWGCEEEGGPPDEGGEEEPAEPSTFSKNASVDLSGYITQFFPVSTGDDEVFVGDNNADGLTKGYLSFDISDLSSLDNIDITDAEVRITDVEHGGEPWSASDKMDILVFYYGDELTNPEDFAVGGVVVKTFNISDSLDNLTFSTDELISEVQKAVDDDKDKFQLKFSLHNKSNNGFGDWYLFKPSHSRLVIEYIESS